MKSEDASSQALFKDDVLNTLADSGNVAQFISFSPSLEQRFGRVHGFPPNHRFGSVADAVQAILQASSEQSVNVRSFDPGSPKSREFIYGLTSVQIVLDTMRRLAAEGLYTIVNETIDVNDGGVSGVALGNVIEFAPCDTPRAVEKPGTVQMPRAFGLRMLEVIYGVRPQLRYPPSCRVEFSLHPLRRGFRRAHTVIWELEQIGKSYIEAKIQWPNRFSRHIGDKAFGLLIADLAGLPVPKTIAFPRNLAPFSFGRDTGCHEPWIRTCPVEQVPGKFTTRRGWVDPYRLMQDEDPGGSAIASILYQAGVDAVYSGALISAFDTKGRLRVTIEGTTGYGDEFMVGRRSPTKLPAKVIRGVEAIYGDAESVLGPVRMEWVADEERTWVVQLHRGATQSYGSTIYPGAPKEFVEFNVHEGLEQLRVLIGEVKGTGRGITVVGQVGLTSHFGDVLRRAQVPSRLEARSEVTTSA